MAHPIVHTEIQVKDSKKALDWYSKVFGWKTNWMEEMNYGVFYAGVHGGGLSETEEYSGTWPYIAVDDVTAALEKIKAAGGQVIIEETPIPTVGSYGAFKDPDGNIFGLLKPDDGPEPEKDDTIPNPLTHFEIRAGDIEKALKWYSDLFDWEGKFYKEMSYGMLMLGDGQLTGGIGPLDDNPAGVVAYVHTDDVDALTAKVKDNGGSVLAEPFDVPTVGRMSNVTDPDGNILGILKYVEEE